jgi:hypothetical protein
VNTFGPKRDEVTVKWRKPHNEGLLYKHYYYDLRDQWAGHVERMGERKGV